MKKIRPGLSTAQILALGFLTAILIGSVLLWLPISSADGQFTNYIDALFTSATSTCVTGLVTVPTATHWNLFGQIVILLLIQCGGLGIVTLTSLATVFIGKKLGIKGRLLLQDAFGMDSFAGQIRFIKRVVKGSLAVEGIGAALYAIRFIPQFGFLNGVWKSVFTAISAFCNAGIDVIGNQSLIEYAADPLINIVTMLLIILGGIGFLVWWDVGRTLKSANKKHWFLKLTLHSKIVIITTAILIFGGAALIFAFEYQNPNTLGNMPLGQKIMAALFQSVTTRTAGFMTISQKGLSNPGAQVCLALMLIGGSPAGTAGGIKTATFAAVMISALSIINNRSEPTAFKRRLSPQIVRRSLAIILISISALFVSTLLLLAFCDGSAMDILFETTSAIATVGLSRDFTPTLNLLGKIVIIITMYLGRTGPATMAIAFGLRTDKNKAIQYPQEDIKLG